MQDLAINNDSVFFCLVKLGEFVIMKHCEAKAGFGV